MGFLFGGKKEEKKVEKEGPAVIVNEKDPSEMTEEEKAELRRKLEAEMNQDQY